MSDEPLDVHDLTDELCSRFNVDPDDVRSILLHPDLAVVEVFKTRDGRKYLDTNGEPARETRRFNINTVAP
jgi:hypothetical protein